MNIFKNWWFSEEKEVDKRLMVYSPKEDITSYEVAKCLEISIFCHQCRYFLTFDSLKSKIESYPSNVRRHFKIEKIK
jgi:hypothetical protein